MTGCLAGGTKRASRASLKWATGWPRDALNGWVQSGLAKRGGEGGTPFARQSNQWAGVLSSSMVALIGIKYNISHPFECRCDFNIHYSAAGGGGGGGL